MGRWRKLWNSSTKRLQQKQNRKERRLAIKSALAEKANEKAILVVEDLTIKTPKTKEMLNVLETLKIADKKYY